MSEAAWLVSALTTGLALGVMFFGGLWWTVQRVVSSPHPARWLLGSTLLRTGVALVGFWLVCGADWKRWLVCLVGFVLARLWVARLTRGRGQTDMPLAGDTRHAP